jgi:predicted dehydrogenase
MQKVGIAGLGGFASCHHQALLELERESLLRVVATCDPFHDRLPHVKQHFSLSERGVQLFEDLTGMMDNSELDWVSIATPLHLHAAMHRHCVEKRLPCYLEKPPTLDPWELEQMIATDKGAAIKTQVGFAYLYEPERISLKKRLLHGDFGRLTGVQVRGASRRGISYYSRNAWAGRLKLDDHLILDSCMGNGMAHHVHNVLFFAGTGAVASWADYRQVEAKLLRANDIEGADTVFLRALLSPNVEMRLALTHACEQKLSIVERLICENAIIEIHPRKRIEIRFRSGEVEDILFGERDNLRENLRFFSDHVRMGAGTILGSLEHCRSFVEINALSYVSSQTIVTACAREKHSEDAKEFWLIKDIEPMLDTFLVSGDFKDIPIDHSSPLPTSARDLRDGKSWNQFLR